MKKKKQIIPPAVKNVLQKIALVVGKVWPTIATVLKIAAGALATVLLICVVCGFVFVGILGDYLQEDILPASDMDMEGYDLEQDTVLYYVDSNGEIQVLQELHTATSSKWADYEDIPQDLIDAAVSIEDHRFFEHQGVDWITTVKACARMFFGDDSVGGSSITQQLIKNILLTEDETADDVTVQRKIMEIFRAIQLEKRYDKKTIMEYYLNCISLGQNSRGVRSAAEAYFGKELEMLTTAECASLISITNSPTYYDPYQNFDNNMERKENVLWAMRNYGYLTEEEYREALAQPIVLKSSIADEDKMTYCPNEECGHKEIRKNLKKNDKGEYLCAECGGVVPIGKDASQEVYSWYVDTVVEDILRLLVANDGMSWNLATRRMYMQKLQSAGWHIYTCLDMEVQEQVDKIYMDESNIPDTRSGQDLQSGIVVIDNRTGDIVALSGGVGEKTIHDEFNRATDADRQSGSSIKPISIYAPAFEAGTITPATVIKDLPMKYTSGAWPRNDNFSYDYSKTILGGVVSSVNAVAANTLDKIGTTYGYDYAKNKFRLSTLVEYYEDADGNPHSDNDFAPLAMGAQVWGVTVRDMANAFATFANNGVYRSGRTYTKIYDSEGNVVIDNTQTSEQILSEKTVDYMNYCLVNATKSGTGYEANLSYSDGITTAGKTGSTSSYKDRWYCGFTGYYTAAVWCGYDQPAQIRLTSSKISNPASYIWKKVMQPLHEDKSDIALYNSNKLYGVTMCLDSGLKATSACSKDIRATGSFKRTASTVTYAEDTPTKTCNKHVLVDYCSGGGVATEYCKHFAEVDSSVKLSETALVKLTSSEVDEIKKAKSYNLKSSYYQDNYVYLINSDGTDGVWKGFSNNKNKDVKAPYIVCTAHTQAAWEQYQQQHPVTPPEVTPPETGTDTNTGTGTGTGTNTGTGTGGTTTP